MEKKVMTSTNKGLIIGLILVVLSVATSLFVTDMEKQQSYAWISYLIMIGCTVWACISYARDMDGNVTFGNVFSHGFKTTSVFTIILVLYTALSLTVIFPEMKDKMLELSRAQMEKDGKLSSADIDRALSMTSKFFVPFAIAGMLIFSLIIGAIGSLIGAAVAKKNPAPTPFQ